MASSLSLIFFFFVFRFCPKKKTRKNLNLTNPFFPPPLFPPEPGRPQGRFPVLGSALLPARHAAAVDDGDGSRRPGGAARLLAEVVLGRQGEVRRLDLAFEKSEEDHQEEEFLELPPFALPRPELPLEINGIADLPVQTLRAGLLPARLNAEAAEDDEGFGVDAVATKLAEWLRFPYATEALLDAAASAADAAAAASSSSEEEEDLSIPLPALSKRHHHRHPKRPLPASVDWSTKNVLGPIKNQHINGTPCGCCWAFATTGVVEAVVGVVSEKSPPSLSEQQIIDCDRGPPFDDLGCDGGSVEGEWRESVCVCVRFYGEGERRTPKGKKLIFPFFPSFKKKKKKKLDLFSETGGVYYIVENHGRLDSEEDYPYSGIDKGEAACRRKKEAKKSALEGSGARVTGFHNVPKKSEAALKAAVAKHPVAVAVCCGDFIDDWHA